MVSNKPEATKADLYFQCAGLAVLCAIALGAIYHHWTHKNQDFGAADITTFKGIVYREPVIGETGSHRYPELQIVLREWKEVTFRASGISLDPIDDKSFISEVHALDSLTIVVSNDELNEKEMTILALSTPEKNYVTLEAMNANLASELKWSIPIGHGMALCLFVALLLKIFRIIRWKNN